MAAARRVILVDDNQRVRQSLGVMFDLLPDWQIVGEAANGQEAINQCARLQPDAVIMDLLMPVMDGITATRLIREQFPAIKILILTSTPDETDIQAARQAGAHAILRKSGSISEIETTLEKVVGSDKS